MWNVLNRARLAWAMRVGRERAEVVTIVKRLRDVLRDAPPPLQNAIVGTQVSTEDRSGYRTEDRSEHSREIVTEIDALIHSIKEQTKQANRNNITRTEAYIQFFQRHPEIHWALLAHCVSRNGGWSMTDTKGEWCIRLNFEPQSGHFFDFLERANWLIFQDAYPQLLLYEEGKRRNQNLSYLLPQFHVSSFMKAMWDWFWEQGDRHVLTRALIINEQNHIESRVVQKPVYMKSVESSIQFRLESLLNMNQVLMPYRLNGKTLLAGTTMRHFQSIEDRIQTGLRLYQILYQDRRIHDAVVRFMSEVPHSGSREDYWPHTFTSTMRRSALDLPYEPRFRDPKESQMTRHVQTQTVGTETDARRIYSPTLHGVWKDVHHAPAEPGDWFIDLRHVIYLFLPTKHQPLDITTDYVSSMRTIERSIAAKKQAAALLGMRTE